jgi:hypothetical protein
MSQGLGNLSRSCRARRNSWSGCPCQREIKTCSREAIHEVSPGTSFCANWHSSGGFFFFGSRSTCSSSRYYVHRHCFQVFVAFGAAPTLLRMDMDRTILKETPARPAATFHVFVIELVATWVAGTHVAITSTPSCIGSLWIRIQYIFWLKATFSCHFTTISDDKTIKLVRISLAATTKIHRLLLPSLLRVCLVPKIFQNFSSRRIFGHVHEALNIDKK